MIAGGWPGPRGRRGSLRRLLRLVPLFLLAAAPLAPARAAEGLRAGAAAVKITPSLTRPVYLAGYASNRLAESVHDDLWARALVLDDGERRVAVVACDLIGLTHWRVRRIRSRIRSVPGQQVLIAATHVHSGPDTLGLWGPAAGTSGLDPLYMARLEDRIVAAVEAAARALEPVTLAAAAREVPDGLVHNSREPRQDRTLTAVRLADRRGGTVATVIHYGAHPEVNKGRVVTSDVVHPLREAVERRFGGVCLFLNGALGGMVTPKVPEHTLGEMRRVGEGLGAHAVAALEAARPQPAGALRLRRREVSLPLANNAFRALLSLGVLDGDRREGEAGRVTTEVWRLDLGAMTWMTIPGEILPRPALELKARLPGRFPLVIALGNDELGYILHPDDFSRDLYRYERSMSVGPETWPLLEAAALTLLRE